MFDINSNAEFDEKQERGRNQKLWIQKIVIWILGFLRIEKYYAILILF